MKCTCCGEAELIHDTRDIPYIYKGETTSIPAVTGQFCPACSEVILNREYGDRYSELLGQFQRQVSVAFVDRILANRTNSPRFSKAQFRAAREEGRP